MKTLVDLGLTMAKHLVEDKVVRRRTQAIHLDITSARSIDGFAQVRMRLDWRRSQVSIRHTGFPHGPACISCNFGWIVISRFGSIQLPYPFFFDLLLWKVHPPPHPVFAGFPSITFA